MTTSKSDPSRKDITSNANLIVVKIGTRVLTRADGLLDTVRIESLGRQVDSLVASGKQVVLVSSGAVGAGMGRIGLDKRPKELGHLQAIAAVGQSSLIEAYERVFRAQGRHAAQVLLVADDFKNRSRYLNIRNTLRSLLHYNAIPIINENDTVATDELKFGDNDRLAARVAQVINADLLVLLSDVDGLYDKNPKLNKDANLIREISEISSKTFKMATSETNDYGSGGMFTKIQAAEIAFTFGCDTLIMKGNQKNPIKNFEKNKNGTLFKSPIKKKKVSFKNWLGGSINISGSVKIDEGAIKALKLGASLLPSGVKKISGNFAKGDIIEILNDNGKKLGRGISYYDSHELNLIKGKKSIYIKDTLGYEGREEIIHRDYLFLNLNEKN